jgi:DNA-binding beta-propeller fold protein YncE
MRRVRSLSIVLALTAAAVAPVLATSGSAVASAPLPTYVDNFVGSGLADMYPVDAAASDSAYYVLDAGRYRVLKIDRTSGAILDQVGGHQGRTTSRFSAARSVARDDTTGNIYLADTSNNRVMEFDSNLNPITSWGVKGTSCNGCFNQDFGVTVGPGLDAGNNPAQVVYTTDGTPGRVQAFTLGGAWIRTFGSGRVNKPRQLAIDPVTNDVYVISAADKMVDVFTPSGSFITSFGGFNKNPNVLGKFSQDQRGIAIDYIDAGSGPVGYVFVSDPGSGWIQVFSMSGSVLCAFGTTGTGDSQFTDIRGITITDDHKLLVTDEWGFALKEFDLSDFDGSCVLGSDVSFIRKLFGSPPPVPGVDSPRGMDVDASGRLFISDWWNQRIERVQSDGGSPPQATNAATWGFRGTRQETGALNFAWDVAVQPGTNRVFVANRESNEVRVFDGNNPGVEVTHWGKQGTGLTAALFKFPQGIDFAPDGVHVFVSDSGNNRIVEFNIGSNGMPSPAAAYASFGIPGTGPGQFKVPAEIAVATDPNSGNTYLWVADTQNNRIQRCMLNGAMTGCSWTTISTPAGGTKFKLPWGVSVDPNGNIWVADSGNNRIVEMTPGGTQIIAFNGTDVGAGAFDHPFDVESMGSLILVADLWNNRIVALQP